MEIILERILKGVYISAQQNYDTLRFVYDIHSWSKIMIEIMGMTTFKILSRIISICIV